MFAVATQDSILFYDSQRLFPFAYVSQIHYLRLTDISWSPDGRMLIVTSTDGFSSFVVFQPNELGTPYHGELLPIEELEDIKVKPPPCKPTKVNSAEKATKSHPTSTPITSFFKKASPSSSTPKRVVPDTEEAKRKEERKQVKRISLITLFSKHQTDKPETADNNSGTTVENDSQYETGVKRKLLDNIDTSECNTIAN